MKIDLKARKRNMELIRQTFDAPTMPKEETLKEGDVCVVIGNKSGYLDFLELGDIVIIQAYDYRRFFALGEINFAWMVPSDLYKIGEL